MQLKKACSLLVIVLLLTGSFTATLRAGENSAIGGRVVVGTREMAGNRGVYELVINQTVVLRYRSAANGYSAAERAAIILQRIRDFDADLLTKPVRSGSINGASVVMIGEKLLITITQADYQANNTTGPGLAKVWTENLKAALHNTPNTAPPTEKPKPEPAPGSSSASQKEQEMLGLVNKERQAAGIKPLEMDSKLVEIARLKSQDMIDKNYFSHTSPTYGDPFTMMKNMGVSFGYAGENLAGNQTVGSAHETLMNSPGHRANILNPNYTHAGIGIVEGGPYGAMFTQLFISK